MPNSSPDSLPEPLPDMVAITFQLLPAENERLSDVCGQLNCHLKQIEHHLGVRIVQRSNNFSVTGDQSDCNRAASVVKRLFTMTEQKNQPLTAGDVHLQLSNTDNIGAVDTDHKMAGNQPALGNLSGRGDKGDESDEVVIRLRKNRISGQNPRQRTYLRNIRDHDISFAIGPAGTGKTYLAVACAVYALAENAVECILLVRPAVEAGEKLGFLPGNIGQKIDPYLESAQKPHPYDYKHLIIFLWYNYARKSTP